MRMGFRWTVSLTSASRSDQREEEAPWQVNRRQTGTFTSRAWPPAPRCRRDYGSWSCSRSLISGRTPPICSADLSSRQQKLEELATTLSVDRAQLAALKDELGAKELRLDGMDKLNQRLAAISELATRSSLSMGKETPGAVTDEPHYKSLQIHYEGKGTYPNFAAFLHQLRTMFPDTSVASLEAKGADTGQGIEFNFELIWYTHK